MASEPLRRCLRLLDMYLAREVPPWRPRQLYGPPPAPLSLGELHRLWQSCLTEGLPCPGDALAAAIRAELATVAVATTRVLALLQEAPRD